LSKTTNYGSERQLLERFALVTCIVVCLGSLFAAIFDAQEVAGRVGYVFPLKSVKLQNFLSGGKYSLLEGMLLTDRIQGNGAERKQQNSADVLLSNIFKYSSYLKLYVFCD